MAGVGARDAYEGTDGWRRSLSGPLLARFWKHGSSDPNAMRYASAALAAGMPTAPEALLLLEQGRASARTEEERRNFEVALVTAYSALKRFDDMEQIGRGLFKAFPESRFAFTMLSGVLSERKQWRELVEVGEERLKRIPDDPLAIRVLASAVGHQGRIDQAVSFYRRLVSLGKAESGDFNNLAWDALFTGSKLDQAIEDGERGMSLTAGSSTILLRTLSVLYAEVGRTADAREMLLKMMELEGLDDPDPKSWYVIGRIAEQLGLTEAAASAYGKLDSHGDEEEHTSTYTLAQRRLKALGGLAKQLIARCGYSSWKT